MSIQNFVEKTGGTHSSVTVQRTDSETILISFSVYPMSSMMAIPFDVARKMASEINWLVGGGHDDDDA